MNKGHRLSSCLTNGRSAGILTNLPPPRLYVPSPLQYCNSPPLAAEQNPGNPTSAPSQGNMGRSSRTIYVGNLPGDIREREVEDLFYKYGRIIDIDLKIPPRPPGYAFIEYEDNRDAEDAIYARDGYDFFGHKLRVELAHGGRGHSSSIDRYSSHSSAGYRGGVSRRSGYRVLVSGLPSSASWQDLKDHMRRAGDVCFSQVFREGRGTTGIVDYTNYEDMKYAIRKLDRSEFRNAFSRAVIKVREYDSRSPTPRSLSCSPRSRSPISSDSARRSSSRSFSKSKSSSRSRSNSPKAVPSRLRPYRSRSTSVSSRSRSRSLSGSRLRSRSPITSPSHNKRSSRSLRKRSPSRSLSHSRSPSA